MRHKRYRQFTFTSPPQAWVSPGSGNMEFSGFVETQADGGKDVLIDGVEVHASLNLTVAGATTFGEDLARFVDSLTIEQVDGVKRCDNIGGAEVRLMRYLLQEPDCVEEMPDFAVGGPTTVQLTLYFPLRKDFADNPEAFSMPADLLKLIRVTMGKTANMSIGASTCTINSGSYYVVAVCHAEAEPLDHCFDTITMEDFQSQLETVVTIGGRPHDVALYCPGAHGGQVLTGLNEVNVLNEYQQSQLVFPDLVRRYARERGEATNLSSTTGQRSRTNPFTPLIADSGAPRAVAAVFSTGNHPNEGQVRDKLRIKTVQSGFAPTGSIRGIYRTLVPRTDRAEQIIGHKHGMPHGKIIASRGHAGGQMVRAADEKYMPRLRGKVG